MTYDSYSNQCPNCGGDIIGDGYTYVAHCENAEEEDYEFCEADAGTVLCRSEDDDTSDSQPVG